MGHPSHQYPRQDPSSQSQPVSRQFFSNPDYTIDAIPALLCFLPGSTIFSLLLPGTFPDCPNLRPATNVFSDSRISINLSGASGVFTGLTTLPVLAVLLPVLAVLLPVLAGLLAAATSPPVSSPSPSVANPTQNTDILNPEPTVMTADDLARVFPSIGAGTEAGDAAFCLLPGSTCDPLIEEVLGLYSGITVEDTNLAKIAAINSQVPPPSWQAGPTSLLSTSYSSVLAYMQGELPPSSSDRAGSTNRAAMAQFLASLSPQRRPREWEVYTSDAKDQGVCSSCSAFAVTSALETCVHRALRSPGFSALPPRGLSQQHLLDCAFNSYGLAGCDGGRSHRYLQWLQGGGLATSRAWPYVDGFTRFEVETNRSLREGYTTRHADSGRCSSSPVPEVEVEASLHSWDSHTEQDIENILLAGHAVVSTMEVAEDLQHYTRGVYYSQQCQNWRLGAHRDYQWQPENGLRPLRHAVVIVGFGEDSTTGLAYWKVKSSWGSLWGESGFLRLQRGQGLCGLGAYISVALCRPYSGSRPLPRANTAPPPGLPEQGVFLGQTTFLTSPLAAQGLLTCNAASGCAGPCSSLEPCRVLCGPRCVARGGTAGTQCCRPLGGRGARLYCPRRGALCAR